MAGVFILQVTAQAQNSNTYTASPKLWFAPDAVAPPKLNESFSRVIFPFKGLSISEQVAEGKKKTKQPWQFSASLLPKCAACIHSCIQITAAGRQTAVQGSSLPAGQSLPKGHEVPWQGAET